MAEQFLRVLPFLRSIETRSVRQQSDVRPLPVYPFFTKTALISSAPGFGMVNAILHSFGVRHSLGKASRPSVVQRALFDTRLGLFADRFRARTERAAIDHADRAGSRRIERGGDFMNVRPDHRPVDRGQNQHGKGAALETLLRSYVLVAGKEHVEALALDQREERAVLDAAPLHADYSVNLVMRKKPRQLARYVLVKKHLQCCACN